MSARITLKFKALFAALGRIGMVSYGQDELRAKVLTPAALYAVGYGRR
jgi:hypothetical protein